MPIIAFLAFLIELNKANKPTGGYYNPQKYSYSFKTYWKAQNGPTEVTQHLRNAPVGSDVTRVSRHSWQSVAASGRAGIAARTTASRRGSRPGRGLRTVRALTWSPQRLRGDTRSRGGCGGNSACGPVGVSNRVNLLVLLRSERHLSHTINV